MYNIYYDFRLLDLYTTFDAKGKFIVSIFCVKALPGISAFSRVCPLHIFTVSKQAQTSNCEPPQDCDAKGESTLTTRLPCLRSRICAY